MRPFPPLIRYETGVLKIHTVLTNLMEDGFSHVLHILLSEGFSEIYYNFVFMEMFLGLELDTFSESKENSFLSPPRIKLSSICR